jgi:hypothetical protein
MGFLCRREHCFLECFKTPTIYLSGKSNMCMKIGMEEALME